MLNKFLWFFSLEAGAYVTGCSCLVINCLLMADEAGILKFSGANQGNLGFGILHFLSSLLLLNGVYRQSANMMVAWLFFQGAASIEGFVKFVLEIDEVSDLYFLSIYLFEIYGWLCVMSLYKKVKATYVVVRSCLCQNE